MKYTMTPLKYLYFLIFYSTSFVCHAMDSINIEKQADSSIQQLYHTLNSMPNISIAERINWFSNHFAGISYVLGSLGEGPAAKFDQFPLYRVDAFDCDTYVNTVLALALANSLESFKRCIKLTRYKKGIVSYINRNHFTSLDWNINNQNHGILKDITLNIKNQKKQSVALYASALIDKPNWYAHKNISTIRLQDENTTKQKKLLADLKNQGSKLKTSVSTTPYLPLTTLFPKKNEPDLYLFSQIPNGAIIEIVRPNWDLRKAIGTSLNISHLGFAIRKKDTLYFRQASSQKGKVIDVPLIDYLKEALDSPTIKGINIQIVPTIHSLNEPCKKYNSFKKH